MIKYKKADNIIFKEADHIFLFLTEQNAIFEIEPEIEKILKLFKRSQRLYKEDIIKKIKDAGIKDYEEIAANLIKRRVFIFPKKENKTGSYNKIPLTTLVLNITDECNLNCLYCYHNKDNKQKKNRMTLMTAQKAVKFMFDNLGNNKKGTIVFFGGEPLIYSDIVKSITEYTQNMAKSLHKEIDFAITTNGTKLGKRIANLFCKNNVGVTISIDGPKEIHDKFRQFPNGKPSYNIILPKIKILIDKFQEAGGKPVVARVTVTEDATHLPQTSDHLLELGFSEVGFAPVTTDNPSYQLNNKQMSRMLNKFKKLSDKFFEYAREDKFYGFTNIIDILVLLHQGEVKNYPCGAGLGLFAVSGDEKFYLCQRLIGNKDFCMGNLTDGFDRKALENFRNKAELNAKPKCKLCEVRYICAGGCYHEALIREKELVKANFHYCGWIKQWIKYGLKIYAKLILTNPDYLDKLSMLRGYTPVEETPIIK